MASSSEKQRGYQPPSSEAERFLARRAEELARAAEYSGSVRTLGFLSDREQELAQAAANRSRATVVSWGGFDGAERRILAFAPEGEDVQLDVFSIEAVRIRAGKPARHLTHRDYLGALMGLGIKRESLGDILVDEEGALVYAHGPAVRLILEELSSVGRCSVTCERAQAEAAQAVPPEERRASVSSLRLDAVLAAMMHVSRGVSAQLIKAGAVSVNHVETARPHYEVFAQDVFRVRGYGKYRLCSVGAQSKKGRTFITYCQY